MIFCIDLLGNDLRTKRTSLENPKAKEPINLIVLGKVFKVGTDLGEEHGIEVSPASPGFESRQPRIIIGYEFSSTEVWETN